MDRTSTTWRGRMLAWSDRGPTPVRLPQTVFAPKQQHRMGIRQSRLLWHDWRLCCVRCQKASTEQAGMPSWATIAAVAKHIPVESPNYWRRRAEEARRRSEQVLDSITRALLLEVAESYERIAKTYEAPRGTKEG